MCVHGEVYEPPPRCVDCGHRVRYDHAGLNPIGSRRFPVRLWIFELIDRLHARMMRNVPYEFWIGGEWDDARNEASSVHRPEM